MTSHFTRFIFTFLFLAILSFQTFSQTNQNNLSGRISDTNGTGLAAAKIAARNQATGEKFTVQTDGEGNFNLENLPAGNYRITVEANGFSSVSREISISGNANESLDISLPVGNISESVTVTATRTQVATTDTAVPVTVISREELERKPVNTIGDVFRDLPGTSTTGEGAFQVRPRIRGLDSNRILILVDGERLNNARTSTGQGGIEIGLVETEQIETVEVVRGAGSVLYGTDALAGTINIITRDAPRNRDEGFRFGGIFNGYFSSNGTGRRGNLAVTGSSKFFSFRVAQSLERYDNYFAGDVTGQRFTAANGITTEGEVLNSQSHGGNTQITTRFFFNDNNDLRLNYERRRARNIGSPTLSLESGFNGYFPFSDRDKFSGRFETRNVTNYLAKISASFYFQNQKRNFTNILFVPPAPPFFPGINNFSETITDTDSYGFDVQSNWLLGSRNFLTAGISFFRDKNKDSRLQETRIPTPAQNRTTSVPAADFGSFAAFAQDEFDVTNRLKLIGGIRAERFFSGSTQTEGFALPPTFTPSQLEDLGLTGFDTGLNVSEMAVTGDFGAVFKVTDSVSLTGRIGRSYRVPNLFERFFTGAGSIGGFLVGNPNLESESGINLDTSIKVRTAKYAGSFTYFNNYYRNFLSTQSSRDRRDCPNVIPTATTVFDTNNCFVVSGRFTEVFQTVNLGRARIQGFEADLEIPIKIGLGFLTPGGNISYLRGDDLELSQPLNTIMPLKTVLNLRWQNLPANYYIDWTTRIVNKQERLSISFLAANGGAEPGFATSDLRGGYNFRREHYRLSFNAGVTNLFNRYYNEQFVFAPARGRSLVFGTTWEIF